VPDERFFQHHDAIALAEALELADATIATAPANLKLRRVVALGEKSGSGALVFLENPAAIAKLSSGEFALCLATENAAAVYDGAGLIAICANPRLSFARIAARLYTERPFGIASGVHSTARIGQGVLIHATASISEGAEIGDGAVIGPGVIIGPGVEIGSDGEIGANASVQCALIDARVKIKPGARLGQSGFGLIETKEGVLPMPQLGRLIVGADVEIGANSTLDRGALGDTKIGDGSKIDNLVQIGHNVVLGRNCIMASQSGIAGSTVLGDGVIIGGQVGVADHLTIGDGVQIAGGSGVMHNIPAGEKWGGVPARPARQWFRETATIARLTKKKK